MAKRRRLDLTPKPQVTPAEPTRAAPPPIAQITGEVSTIAAAQGVMDEVERARGEGRLVISLALDEIAVDHLVRDRMVAGDEDMEALKASISAHGQRTPIEVVKTNGGGFGLISGWRRLAALTALHRETGEARFAKAKALIRTPQDAGEAYVAMVEENEIRVGLSYYERARIATLAAERGAFPDTEAAVSALYASGSRAKRSKIRSFLSLHEVLGDKLQFPAHIPERLGLKIAAALKAGHGNNIRRALKKPAATAEDEALALTRALTAPGSAGRVDPPKPLDLTDNIRMHSHGAGHKITLEGAGLDDQLIEEIKALILRRFKAN